MDGQRDAGRLSRRAFGRRAVPVAGAVLGAALLPKDAEAAGTAWNLTGNAGTTPTSFLGTTDSKPVVVKTGGVERLRVTPVGNLGVGVTTALARVHASGDLAQAGLFERTSTTSVNPALQGRTASRGTGAVAVHGSVTDAAPGSNSTGVRGANAGTGASGIGVWGSHAGSGYGMYASAGSNGYGIVCSASGSGYGLVGFNNAVGSGAGGKLQGNTIGLLAIANDPSGTAVLARNNSANGTRGIAVQGYSASGNDSRVHPGGTFYDAAGEFCGPNGVIGAASTDATSGYGVIGLANNSAGVGVYASGTGGASAILALGDVDIFGTLTKSGGSFRIDHPLAPAERYLSHSFVESPDMKNVYDGVVRLDAHGRATVTMPDYFEALNRDVRYQLTAIGGPAPDLHVADKVAGGRFGIAGGQPGQEVSWQLTGIRQDTWANAHRIPVEHDKPARDRGRFLHPDLHGAAADAHVGQHQPSITRMRLRPAETPLQS